MLDLKIEGATGLVGHGTLRIAAMGFARRSPTSGELTRMQRLMTDAMEDGAWGLSTGLIYAPGSYSETAEIVAVARAAARYRGFYASHIRGEGATLLDAIREAISVGREGELPVQVSHVKAAGRPNWGNVSRALALIDAARAEGLDVRADVYPYTASSTTLRTLLPDWALEGGIDAMLKRLTDPAERARVRAAVESPSRFTRLSAEGDSGGARARARRRGIALGGKPGEPRRLGERDDLLLREAQRRRGQAPVGDRAHPRHRPDRCGPGADRGGGREGLHDPLPAGRGGPAHCAGPPARDDRLRRQLAGAVRPARRGQAAPALLRHLPARARRIRARAAHVPPGHGRAQDDRAAGRAPRPARPRRRAARRARP